MRYCACWNRTAKGKEQSIIVMELPPYRLPTPRGIWLHTWERTSAFIRKAWTTIMAVSILLWLLMAALLGGQGSFAETDVNHSVFATVNRVLAPVFAPLGVGCGEASSAREGTPTYWVRKGRLSNDEAEPADSTSSCASGGCGASCSGPASCACIAKMPTTCSIARREPKQ